MEQVRASGNIEARESHVVNIRGGRARGGVLSSTSTSQRHRGVGQHQHGPPVASRVRAGDVSEGKRCTYSRIDGESELISRETY